MQKSSSGYGKRPLWQWVLIYIVVGGIVYGLIYYFVLAKKGGYNYSGNTNTSTQNSQQTAPPSNSSY